MAESTEGIPFPSMDDMPEISVQEGTLTPSPEPSMMNSASTANSPVESHNTTSSSKLTSSDKLTALPPTGPNPMANFSRPTRSSAFAMSNIKRGWRHSFDASTPLPSTFASDHDLSMLSHGAWAQQNFGVGHHRQGTPESGSAGKETPKQRISLDSDRNSLPTMRSVGQAFSRLGHGSDPPIPSPPLRASPFRGHRDESTSRNEQHLSSRSPSQSRSRATSPLRILQQWSSGFHRGHRAASDDPFVPVDPFKLKTRFPFCPPPTRNQDIEEGGSAASGAYDCDDLLPINSVRSFFRDSRIFMADVLPRELYLNLLLRLPAMYFSRVARIFEDADVSRPDIQRMISASGRGPRGGLEIPMLSGSPDPNVPVHSSPPVNRPTFPPVDISGIGTSAQVGAVPGATIIHTPLPFPDEWTPPLVSPALIRFKHSWETFTDSLLREWKTLNVVSALLASAILTIFQIPDAADDPVTRTFALLSLICALMSLSYGCMYIVRFGTMRSMFHASRWAEEAQKTKTLIWWNVWVFLATPAVWMAWAMLLFISSILSFVWRTGSVLDPESRPPLGARAVLGPRIVITSVLALGLIYLFLIIRTFKKYGSQQNSAREILRAGSKKANGDVDDNSHRRETKVKKSRLGNDEVEMERRGRERERSTSAHIRRKEETERKHKGESSERGSKRGGVLGLGSGSKVYSRDEGREVGMDMDLKFPGDNSVEETTK
ncbi:hypothetical protein GALMADRAFT_801755 [Galerina marginata CBS 339.88]|uniref:Uncharacterized protein n=1 Tax=Galerina marginata (strain CBS 339.88) TaxID=685588 RepID=A0A067SWA1_GALM3|nr:hypothetical protein GALMADRAFT_801755 [Galerina marginata CBS 339.88]